MTRRARTMRAPNACAIAWWPRHTPRIGTFPANRAISSSDTPASSGVHGPGETTTCDGAIAAISSTDAASLRNTVTASPNSPKYCTRFHAKLS